MAKGRRASPPNDPRSVEHGGGVELVPGGSTRSEPPSVFRARAGCGRRLLPTKLAVVMHYLPHQLLNDLLSNDPILLACQLSNGLRDRINDVIGFIGIDFV